MGHYNRSLSNCFPDLLGIRQKHIVLTNRCLHWEFQLPKPRHHHWIFFIPCLKLPIILTWTCAIEMANLTSILKECLHYFWPLEVIFSIQTVCSIHILQFSSSRVWRIYRKCLLEAEVVFSEISNIFQRGEAIGRIHKKRDKIWRWRPIWQMVKLLAMEANITDAVKEPRDCKCRLWYHEEIDNCNDILCTENCRFKCKKEVYNLGN